MSDISERRALQAGLAQADRMATMGILAAGIGHEINNPLTYVLYNIGTLAEDLPRLSQAMTRCLEALRDRVGQDELSQRLGADLRRLDPAELEEHCERAKRASLGTQRIMEIARGLSHLARVDQNPSTRVDINSAVSYAIVMANNEIKCRAVLEKDLRPVPRIAASEGKIAQVFLNLLVNAAHSIEEGSVERNRITIRTRSDEEFVIIEISDTGAGIAEDDLDRIFEPFFTTKTVGRGLGLGLAVTQRIVSSYGGRIHVESDLCKGSKFSVYLPISEGSEGPAAVEHERSRVGRAAERARGRVLIVDDEDMVRRAIGSILSRSCVVVLAASGAEAQDLLSNDAAFDLVLCDLMMPETSGVQLHQWLQEHHPHLAKHLVFITGGVFTAHTREYLDRTGNLCLEKPFASATLRDLVATRITAARRDLPALL